MPQQNIFNGGLRTAQAAHLIKENESVIFSNIDHIPGILTPIRDKYETIYGAAKYGHYFTSGLQWYWSATPKDYVEFQERLYIGNRTGISTKIVNGIEYNMGIQQPTTTPTVVISDETPDQDQITRLDLTPVSTGGDIPDGTFLLYKVVNISSTGRYYPSESHFSITLDTGTDTNKITLACGDTNVDTEIAVFRFFDNYWRLIYEGVAGSVTEDDTYDISTNDEDEGYEPHGLQGTYQYALTFYNSVDGTESAPVLSTEYDADWGTATVSNLEIATDVQVNQRKLYRIGGASTAFTLVATLDNVVTSYVDTFRDDELEGSLMTSQQNFPPVNNLKYMMEAYAMLFAADGDKLRFTPIGEPDYWPQTYFLDFPRTITGLAKTPIGILVFNEFETWLVTGTGPLSLAQQMLTGSQGCINGDSVVNIKGAAIWASTDGICMSNGGEVGVITDDKLSKQDYRTSINAEVYDEKYYLVLSEGGETLIMDMARQIIKTADYGIISLHKANDILYGYLDNCLYELEESSEPLLSMHYKSPKYIGAGYSRPKVYKNFYMFSEGEITIKIYIDGGLVQEATYNTRDNHQIKVPSEHSRGFDLQFEITGTGTVYELQWEDGNANQ